ncbi:4-hydroxybutyrate dehydrogenase [Megasphaera paucivorans]|uniref:4-hydroxybutyrate dehydrogenase n=1 Tax=Megasphaera paucivorans TaxID=349095 RepID=A0A1H0AR56_9FIRM|nr:4-hydroxybutyrate dehydrogenase [Megasphaera paucivorans]SDN35871.1 4-hydroxybutyrate dehydrogenase [Megasphaera paucivorans]
MIELKVRPTIVSYNNFQQFAKIENICENDLILTNHYIYEADIEILHLHCHVLFQEEYGFGEPTDTMLEAIYKDFPQNIRRIIAVGGGTVLDISKLLSLKQCLPIRDLYDGKIPVEKDKKLILIPTTCGTGSEVTNVAVVTFTIEKKKEGLVQEELYAEQAVLIPQLLKTLPFNVFATTSVDALIHAIEAALSPRASETVRMFCYTAIEMIMKGYFQLREEGAGKRKLLYQDFLLASTYAGIASANAGCGAVHALSYPLAVKFHVPHGEANYALFTGVMKNYMELKPDGEIEKINKFIANLLKCPVDLVYDELEILLDQLLPKKALWRYGVKKYDLVEFTDSVIETQQRLMSNNFVLLNKDRVYKIYKELL